MMDNLKLGVRNLTLNLYCLGIFVLFFLAFKWGAPYLVKIWGPTQLGNLLGTRVVRETLEYFFYFLGLGLILFLVVNFYYLMKIFQGALQIEEDLREKSTHAQKMGQEMGERANLFFTLLERQDQVLKNFLKDYQHKNQSLSLHWNKMKGLLEKLAGVRSEIFHLQECLSLESPEKQCPPPDPEGLTQDLEKLHDLLFHTQFLAYNASIESNRGEAEAGDLALLTKEVEVLVEKSGFIAEGIKKGLLAQKEYQANEVKEGDLLAEKRAKNWERFIQNFEELHLKSQEIFAGLDTLHSQLDKEKTALQIPLKDWEEEGRKMGDSIIKISHDLKKIGQDIGVSKVTSKEVVEYLPHSRKEEKFNTTLLRHENFS